MKRLSARTGSTWTPNLIALAISVFLFNFGNGIFTGVNTNFAVQTLGLDGKHVLWLAGLREVPGLVLMFIAALLVKLPLTYRAAFAVVFMAVGYGLYAFVHSFTGLVAMGVVASVGFHLWVPMRTALAMALTPREESGRVMGRMTAVLSLASIVGVGAVTLLSRAFSGLSLRAYYIIGGVLVLLAAIFVLRLPRTLGAPPRNERRLLLKRRYWVFYVLTFFEGSRVQVFHTFGTLILVQNFGWDVGRISLLLMVSHAVNFLASPYLGRAVDRIGERVTLAVSYVLLALCFVGYATVNSPWLLGPILICINLLVLLHFGLQTYVNRIAPTEELTPTLNAGVSINHVTSVGMSLVAGSLLAIVGYRALCWGVVGVILASVPFALAMRRPGLASAAETVAAPAQ